MPKDFSQNAKAFNFVHDGVSLGDEQTIMFDEKDIQKKIAERNTKIRAQNESFAGRINQTWGTDPNGNDLAVIGEEDSIMDESLHVAAREPTGGPSNILDQASRQGTMGDNILSKK
jgi:hypothetical protein